MRKIKFTLLMLIAFIGFSVNVNAQYFTEDFENAGAFPTGWTLTNGTDDWDIDMGNDYGPGSAQEGTYCAFFNDYDYTAGVTADMISPVINLSGATAPELKFWYWDSGGSDVVEVLVSTDGTTYTSVYTTAGTVSPWTEITVDLTSYAGESNFTIAFRGLSVWGTSNPHVDNIVIAEPPSCPAPSALTVANITGTGADLGWTENGLESAWNIEYGVTGFTLGTGTEIAASTNPYSISGLALSTTYDFYVQAYCDVTDQSVWVGPLSFTTLCGVISPDYLADFTTFLPNCWDENEGPITGPTGTPGIGGWGADGFGNVGTTGAAKFNLYNIGDQDWLISPEFDLSSGGYEINVDAAVCAWNTTSASAMGSDDEVQILYTTDGTTWNSLYTWNAGNVPSNTGSNVTIDISAITGSNVTFAIWVNEGTTDDTEDYDFFIDNFAVRTPPACPEPTALTATNITQTSADLGWTVGDSETSWNIEWGLQGFTLGTGTPVAGTGDNPYSLSGLSAATSYDFYVQAYCSVTEQSTWVGPLTFSTECDVFALPFTETFDGTDFPLCWSQTIEGALTSNRWSVNSGNAAGGDANEMIASFQFTTGISRLITPGINTSGETEVELSFLTYYDDYAAGATLKIQSSTDGITWTDEAYSYVTGSGNIPTGTTITVPITSNVGATTYIAFVIEGNHAQIDYWYVDNVSIHTPPVTPELTWDATTFTEAVANDGSISTVVNLSLTDETFATTGDLTAATHYNVANVPAGLTVVINASDANTATVTLTGNAAAHENANDVTDMEITFLDAAFTGGVAADVTGYTQTALVVDFEDAAPVVALIINEVDADQNSTDGNEFIELFDGGVGNTSLDGYSIVLYNGGTTDLSYDAIDLTGYSTDAEGYFVIGSATVPNVDLVAFTTNSIQNGQDAVALYYDVATNFPDGSAITTTNLVDALVYGTDDPDDAELQVLLNAGQPQISEGTSSTAPFYSCSRIPNGSGGARNTDTYAQAIPTPGASNQAIPVLTWDATTFVEAVANDGSVSTVVNLSLADETFATVGALTATTDFTVANVPTGLTVEITTSSATEATVSLTGNAAAHANIDDVANMEITFTDAAFTSITANLVTGSSQTALVVDFNDPDPAQLAWDATTFVEAAANDGTIETVVNLTLTDETFVTVGALTATTDFNVANVPAGLTVEITTSSATEATVSLTGSAAAHENADDIANMEITFLDAAFTGGVAADVVGYSQTTLAVDFNDAVVLTTDLTIVFPEAENYVCDFDGTDTIPIAIMNIGETTIASGSTINIFYQFDGGPVVSDAIVLASDLAPTETVMDLFDAEEDLASPATYNWTMWLEFADDDVAANNTITGILVSYDVMVDLGGVNDTITVSAYPTTLDAGTHPYTATYLWGDMSTNQTLTVTADGWYGVVVEDENGCWDEDSVYVILDVNVSDVEASTVFNVYPNPNKGIFTYEINTTASENMVVELTNVHGQVVYSREENAVSVLTEEIDIRSFADGVYFLKVRTQTQNLVKKIVVQ
ncbi:MAG: choice-of-anchor J domain-containing protein [Bacteroidales bacterium]|nr:choice-of-anchor J domain-containing protein [Bacteroidales bacterium]